MGDLLTPEPNTILHYPPILGLASSYSAIYTGLMLAQSISMWTCPNIHKTVISLDLDVDEKAYLLVHSRNDLREKIHVKTRRVTYRICCSACYR